MDSLLALSERIAVTSCPPVGWTPDQPLRLHRPPYPTEDLMRASKLFAIMNAQQSPEPQARQEAAGTAHGHARSSAAGPLHQDVPDGQPAFLDLDLNPDLL